MKSCGYYVLCYNEKALQEKTGETKKIGPFKKVMNAFARKQMEEKNATWAHVEVVEKVIITE